MPVRLMCEALKEVYRAKMVHDGVSHAAKLFPNAYLVMVSIAKHVQKYYKMVHSIFL